MNQVTRPIFVKGKWSDDLGPIALTAQLTVAVMALDAWSATYEAGKPAPWGYFLELEIVAILLVVIIIAIRELIREIRIRRALRKMTIT